MKQKTETLAAEMSTNVATAAGVMKALSKPDPVDAALRIDGWREVREYIWLSSLTCGYQPCRNIWPNSAPVGLSHRAGIAQTIYYRASDGVAHDVVNSLCSYYRQPD